MGYVLNERRGEEASGITIIEAHGVANRIEFAVDHIKQEPKITHFTETSSVTNGTRITVSLPVHDGRDWIEYCQSGLLRVVESYAWLNPHLRLRLTWNGKVACDFNATHPNWSKWSPSWPN
jgi:hypothetical protein